MKRPNLKGRLEIHKLAISLTALSTMQTYFINRDATQRGMENLCFYSVFVTFVAKPVRFELPMYFDFDRTLKRRLQLGRVSLSCSTLFFFCLLVLHATPDSLGLDNWGTWHRCWHLDSIGERRYLVTGGT